MSLIPLTAGPLSLLLDSGTGALRTISVEDSEILRGITAPVRDGAWMTVRPEVSDLVVDQRRDGFRATFNVRCRSDAVDFRWQGEVRGEADGALAFRFEGAALADFHRNRIGFCVLHPAEVAGRPCVVEQIDGTRNAAQFPREISPHQPFLNLRAITHEFAPGRHVEVQVEGDVFETEDQRNWTDASFKTYCTPLALARPVLVTKGTRIQQSVTVRLLGTVPRVARRFTFPWEQPLIVEVRVQDAPAPPLPRLGIVWNAGAPAESIVAALRPLGLAHLRVDLRLGDPGYPTRLRDATAAADALSAELEVALFLNDAAEQQVAAFARHLASVRSAPRVARWLLFHENHDSTPPELVALLRRHLAGTDFVAPIGGGSTDNFTELNREPGIALAADFTVHALNPQVHAFDSDSLVETLEMQGITVANARRLSAGRPAVVSPVTLTPRWRVGAAGCPSAGGAGALLPFREDPRQSSPFAAAWMLGSFASLASHGTASVTYFETIGANGIIAANGEHLPVAKMLVHLAPFTAGRTLPASTSHPRHITALAVENATSRRLIVANLEPVRQRVRVTLGHKVDTLEVDAHGIRIVDVDRSPSPQ